MSWASPAGAWFPSGRRTLISGRRRSTARSETAAQKPAFRAAFRYRRCLIPSDGFYEWSGSGRKKQPFFIHLENRKPFAFAGLWRAGPMRTAAFSKPAQFSRRRRTRSWRNSTTGCPLSCQRRSYADWLNPDENRAKTVQGLLKPYPADAFAYYPVSERVNSPRNDDAACLERRPEEKKSLEIQGSLFGD